MSDRPTTLRRPSVRRATAWILTATVAGSVLLTGGLAARMAAGNDAALAPKAKARVKARAQAQAPVPQPDPVTTSTS